MNRKMFKSFKPFQSFKPFEDREKPDTAVQSSRFKVQIDRAPSCVLNLELLVRPANYVEHGLALFLVDDFESAFERW